MLKLETHSVKPILGRSGCATHAFIKRLVFQDGQLFQKCASRTRGFRTIFTRHTSLLYCVPITVLGDRRCQQHHREGIGYKGSLSMYLQMKFPTKRRQQCICDSCIGLNNRSTYKKFPFSSSNFWGPRNTSFPHFISRSKDLPVISKHKCRSLSIPTTKQTRTRHTIWFR
jgi:hypothetical protein